MRHPAARSPATPLLLLVSVAIGAACSADKPSAPQGAAVDLCHLTGTAGAIISVAASEVTAHRSHGDYLTSLTVNQDPAMATDSQHFRRIGDAVAVARTGRLARGEQLAAACRITIAVAAGQFRGDVKDGGDPTLERFPIIIDVPDITLQGALQMQVATNGRALGTGVRGVETWLTPVAPLQIEGGASSQTGASTPVIIANAHPSGSAGNGLAVQGFVFQSGHFGVDTLAGGQGVSSMRVKNLVIHGNRFEAGFSESIDLRASSASVTLNYLRGTRGSCDICVAGPGDFQVADNVLMAGGVPGIFVVPVLILPVHALVEQYTLPTVALVTATVTNNEVRDHLRKPIGVGIRIGAIGIGAPNVAGTSRVTARSNSLINNGFGIIIDAAFPVAGSALRGDVDLTLADNIIQQSCQANLLVSFSRHTTALGLTNVVYSRGSTYALTLGGNASWNDAWFRHPAALGNSLMVDGQPIASGARAFYDAARTCVPLP